MNFDLRQRLSVDLHQVLSSESRGSGGSSRPWFTRRRVHRYQEVDMGCEFVIEPYMDEPGCFVMTSQRAGVKTGDFVTIAGTQQIQSYQVMEIDYYCDEVPDMWIAKLVPAEVDG